MESLFTLQYTCLLVFAMLMLQLLVSRLYQNSTTPQYEKSRLLLAATMLILVVHYALQIKFKQRANDDNVGTVFNTHTTPHQQRHRRRHINVRPLHKSKLSIAFHAVVHTYFCCNLATGIICRRSANAVHYVSVRFKFCGIRLQHGSR